MTDDSAAQPVGERRCWVQEEDEDCPRCGGDPDGVCHHQVLLHTALGALSQVYSHNHGHHQDSIIRMAAMRGMDALTEALKDEPAAHDFTTCPLREYVQHKGGCPSGEAAHTVYYGSCDCGLSSLLGDTRA